MSVRVLVLGGTGTLGSPVVRSLAGRGHTVRILVRNAEKARRMFGDEVEVVPGDSTSRDHLNRALEGCDALHVSLPTESELVAVRQATDLAASGAAGGLRRISYVSGTSVREENRWFEVVDVKMRTEKALERSGIPHVVFCPTWAMEVLPNFVRPERAVVIEGKRPPRFHFFAAADFGEMVATSYQDDRALGKRLFVHGPRSTTLPEAIRAFHAAVHPQVRLRRLTPWQARLVARLSRNPSLGAVARLIAYFDATEEHGDPSEANALLGSPSTDLSVWVEEWADRQGRTLE